MSGERWYRGIVTLALALGVAGGGLSALCGGAFTVVSLDAGPYAPAVLIVSLPSLLVGGGLCWWCVRRWKNRAASASRQKENL